jgi:hypothetical protein
MGRERRKATWSSTGAEAFTEESRGHCWDQVSSSSMGKMSLWTGLSADPYLDAR